MRTAALEWASPRFKQGRRAFESKCNEQETIDMARKLKRLYDA